MSFSTNTDRAWVGAIRREACSGCTIAGTIDGSAAAYHSTTTPVQTVTYTTVSYQTQTATSYVTYTTTTTEIVTTTAVTSYYTTVVSSQVSTVVQTLTTSYVATTTQYSTIPGMWYPMLPASRTCLCALALGGLLDWMLTGLRNHRHLDESSFNCRINTAGFYQYCD